MIPEKLRNRLRMPAMVAPLFLVSGPDLVVEFLQGWLYW